MKPAFAARCRISCRARRCGGARARGGGRRRPGRSRRPPRCRRSARPPRAAPPPADDERDRDRIVRMQEALRDIVHGGVLRRTRVGIRVMDASSGRLFFSQRSGVLMDPASNQKVLATTTALVRLGADWRFRTELYGPLPTADGIIVGDVILRGSGDPTLRSGDLDALATALARRGVRAIVGRGGRRSAPHRRRRAGRRRGGAGRRGRRLGPADAIPDAPLGKLSPRVPLVVNHGLMLVRVRPGAEAGMPAEVTTTPADPSFVIHNDALTKPHRHVAGHGAAQGRGRAHRGRRRRPRRPGAGRDAVPAAGPPPGAVRGGAHARGAGRGRHHRARRRARRGGRPRPSRGGRGRCSRCTSRRRSRS